jgi:hypothetical protein
VHAVGRVVWFEARTTAGENRWLGTSSHPTAKLRTPESDGRMMITSTVSIEPARVGTLEFSGRRWTSLPSSRYPKTPKSFTKLAPLNLDFRFGALDREFGAVAGPAEPVMCLASWKATSMDQRKHTAR